MIQASRQIENTVKLTVYDLIRLLKADNPTSITLQAIPDGDHQGADGPRVVCDDGINLVIKQRSNGAPVR